MQDLVPIGTGNSRYLKSVSNFKTLYPTYDSFAAALVAGTLPVDFNGINMSGIAQIGTALNKATLLKDATAAMYGLGGDAVPDDVFAHLGRYMQHWWKRTPKQYHLTETAVLSDMTDYYLALYKNTGTLYCADTVQVDKDTGEISLVNPQEASNLEEGKYYQSSDGALAYYDDDEGYVSDVTFVVKCVDASMHSANVSKTIYNSDGFKVPAAEYYAGGDDAYTYVQSNDRDAHPDNDYVDDVLYQYLGIPLNNAIMTPAVEIISYTGTDTYGADNPNSITFSRAPQLIIMIGARSTIGNKTWSQLGANEEDWIYMLPTDALPTEYENRIGLGNNANGYVYGKKSEDGKTISWYNGDNARWQYNDADYTYYLLALFDGVGNGRSHPGRS